MRGQCRHGFVCEFFDVHGERFGHRHAAETSPNSHRLRSPDCTDSPMADGVSQNKCHRDFSAGQTSSHQAGDFQFAFCAAERSTITARSPAGESFLSNSSIGGLANSASPPRATSRRKASALPVTMVWASTATTGCGQGLSFG